MATTDETNGYIHLFEVLAVRTGVIRRGGRACDATAGQQNTDPTASTAFKDRSSGSVSGVDLQI